MKFGCFKKQVYCAIYLFLMQILQSLKRTLSRKHVRNCVPQNQTKKTLSGRRVDCMVDKFLLRKSVGFLRMFCILGFEQQVEDVQMKEQTVSASELQ